MVDGAWNERLLDFRTRSKRRTLVRIVTRWLDRCADDGYQAAELDNLDSFSRSKGLISKKQTRRYAAALVRKGHAAGLAVAQKNRAQWNGTVVGFDFAIAEECGRWKECADYIDHYGDLVLAVEYRKKDFRWTCRHFGAQLPVVRRDLALSPDGIRRWC
ncbi:MAG: endo alpha-1,4 polygalactosaminidase [Nocardioides sp.]